MKRMNLCKTALCCLAMAAMFTSCLNGGSNIEQNYALGVVRTETKTMKKVLDVSNYDSFYAPAFSIMDEGACCLVVYTLDFGLPENHSSVVSANGYFTVTINDKVEIDRYSLSGVLADTAKALENECPVLNPLVNLNGYVKGLLFMTHQLKQPSDQQTTWQLTYDAQNRVKEEDGYPVYDLYLRAVVRSPGNKSSEEASVMNAYDMGSYLTMIAQEQKTLNQSLFYLRFNYVSEIKEDQIGWKQAEKRPVQVTDILGNE